MKKFEEMSIEEVIGEIRKFEEEKFDKERSFVFVSYSHRDKQTVLKYVLEWIREGYNIAIDLDFENHSSDTSWIDLMERRLRSDNCVRVICFRSSHYYYSYASLIEVLLMRSEYLINKRCVNKEIPIDVYTIEDPIKLSENEKNRELYQNNYNEIKKSLGSNSKFFDKKEKEKNELRYGLETLCKNKSELISADECIRLIEEKFTDGYTDFYNKIYSLFDDWFSVNHMNGNFKSLSYDPRPNFEKQKVYKFMTNNCAASNNETSANDKTKSAETVDDTLLSNNTEKIGAFVKENIPKLFEQYTFSEEEITMLLDKEYSRKTFGLSFPFLSKEKIITKVKDRDIPRCYKDPIRINGKDYYLTSQWLSSQFEPLKEWIKTTKNRKSSFAT